MKIVIPGGSGQVGTILARALHGDGHHVVVLSRRPLTRPWRVVEWDGARLGAWRGEIDGSDVVINLAGRSVNCRYHAANRVEILQSRVLSTRAVGEAIACSSRPPRVWLLRHGLGGKAGDGRQFISWIHYEDFLSAVRWLIERHEIEGIVNVASPNPLPNAEFMRLLRRAYGVSFGLPAREWMLEMGAALMRTETELILKSRRVVPGRLLEHGFTFRFPTWDKAAPDLCEQWRRASRA